MIILDTNVLSEAIRPLPAGAVLEWLAAQPPSSLFTTAITQTEILHGLASMRVFPAIARARRRVGRPMAQADAQIAAIARSRGAALDTRNTADFEHCGIEVLNPWEWQSPSE
jgi:hypothetical protein